MKRFISSPAANAVCISVFSIFYFCVFLITPQSIHYQKYVPYAILALTIPVVLMLIRRKGKYDEYHTSILMQCLVVALVLTMGAIALFALALLKNPVAAVDYMMLFITLHWSSVVLCDLAYVLICRRK